MLFPLFVLVSIVAAVSLIASAIAGVCRFLTRNDVLSLRVGTFTMPALICASFTCWVVTMEADDVAPGNALIGSLIALVVVTPTALIASRVTVRTLLRRSRSSGS